MRSRVAVFHESIGRCVAAWGLDYRATLRRVLPMNERILKFLHQIFLWKMYT